MSRMQDPVLLVRSLPFDTVEEALRVSGEALGGYVPCLPDGALRPPVQRGARRIGRRLDFVHLPAVRRPQEDFFAPLADLDVGRHDGLPRARAPHVEALRPHRARAEAAAV